jgi:hypothetical protein
MEGTKSDRRREISEPQTGQDHSREKRTGIPLINEKSSAAGAASMNGFQLWLAPRISR